MRSNSSRPTQPLFFPTSSELRQAKERHACPLARSLAHLLAGWLNSIMSWLAEISPDLSFISSFLGFLSLLCSIGERLGEISALAEKTLSLAGRHWSTGRPVGRSVGFDSIWGLFLDKRRLIVFLGLRGAPSCSERSEIAQTHSPTK